MFYVLAVVLALVVVAIVVPPIVQIGEIIMMVVEAYHRGKYDYVLDWFYQIK